MPTDQRILIQSGLLNRLLVDTILPANNPVLPFLHGIPLRSGLNTKAGASTASTGKSPFPALIGMFTYMDHMAILDNAQETPCLFARCIGHITVSSQDCAVTKDDFSGS